MTVLCSWIKRRCQKAATHFHPVYGELCRDHALILGGARAGVIKRIGRRYGRCTDAANFSK